MRLYSDDFGYDRQVDRGLIKLIKEGKIIGTSVLANMVDGMSLGQLKRSLKIKKNFILGLHINLIEGFPTLPYIKLMTLLDSNGKFFPLIIFLLRLWLGLIDKSQIRSEVENQLYKLTSRGFRIRILDSHQHTHAFSPVAEIVTEIATELKIPYIRSMGSLKNYTFKAKWTYLIVKLLAFFSYLITYKKIGLPATWNSKQKFDWTVMSWEGKSLKISNLKAKNAAFIIHPYLSYDSNTSYQKYLR